MAPPKKKPAPAKKRAAGTSASARKRVAAQPSRREKEARALRNRIIIGGVLLVLAGALVFFAARPGGGPSTEEQIEAGPGSCLVDEEYDGDGSNQGDHVSRPTYEVDPPAGGPHLATPANPGFYRPGSAPPDGQLVHAQEHGFVVLWYRPDLPDAELTQLEQLSDQFGRELLLVPRESLTGEIAVTAWHKRMLCQELFPEQVSRFTRAFVDKGPEKGFL